MKFRWNLDKVLDIRKKQEQLLKTELFEVTQKQVNMQQKIMLEEMEIRSAALRIKEMPPYQRMEMQRGFLSYSFGVKSRIDRLKDELKKIEKQRQEKLKENIIARKNRKALEKLRQTEFEKFVADQNKKELDMLDDITNTKTAREKLEMLEV